MSKRPSGSGPASSLPDAPNLEWLRKQAKHRLAELRQAAADAKLADAQLDVARQYGFPSWRALKAHVDSLFAEGQALTGISRSSTCCSRAASTRTPARRATTRTPCTGPRRLVISTSCVTWPTRAATWWDAATITSSR